MTKSLIGLKKSPSTFIVVAATGLLFAGAVIFGHQMVPDPMWQDDPSHAVTSAWSNLGGLYFGILLPILVASCAALVMAPEHQRGNVQWLRSQPHGASLLLREKVAALGLISVILGAIHVLVTLTFGFWQGYSSVPQFSNLVVYAATTVFGVFAVGTFYMWVSTFLRGTASTISVGIALTVTSMALTVFEQVAFSSTTIETVLPTTQLISTALVREAGTSTPIMVLLKVLIALGWSGVFILLTRRRLASAS
nr:Uncharacterized protein conserved in bacteria [Streptococcus thermophilus]